VNVILLNAILLYATQPNVILLNVIELNITALIVIALNIILLCVILLSIILLIVPRMNAIQLSVNGPNVAAPHQVQMTVSYPAYPFSLAPIINTSSIETLLNENICYSYRDTSK
jgi:hypothetical protein